MGASTESNKLALMGLSPEYELTLICTREEGALIGDARRIGAYVRILGGRSGWDFSIEKNLRRILTGHTPDILHTSLFGFDLFANRAARAAGAPVIIASRRELPIWQRRRHRFIQHRANRYVDCFVANSQAVRDYAVEQEKIAADRCRIIPNGIHADAFLSHTPLSQLRSRFRLPNDKHIIGMVANFSPVKDHRLFMAMADLILKRREDVHFLLVGTGPLVDQIGDWIRRHRYRTHFNRVSSVGEMHDLYNLMDVSVLTSKMEGFPNAIMESMAAGKPIVASAVGGIRELIQDGETGRLIRSRNPQDFADAVFWYLDHPEEAKRISSAAAAWVRQELPMQKMIDAYRALYLELLERPAHYGILSPCAASAVFLKMTRLISRTRQPCAL